jgi:hypothetical protein
MLTQPFAIDAEQRQRHISSRENASLQLNRRPLWISIGAATFLCMTLLVLGVVTLARWAISSPMRDLPQAYLPDSPLPKDVSCYTPGDEHLPRCFIHLWGRDVYFTFDADTRIINRTIIPAPTYNVGMLIAAWGTPTGITQAEHTISIRWGTRSALLYTRSPQPDSRIEFILYDLAQQQSSTWRGFMDRTVSLAATH